MKGKVYIGTSGWSYTHWKENFYPKGLNSKEWLHYYSNAFSTVEVNSTFYHIPSDSTMQNWYAQVPSNFLFSIKANRYFTHIKRLKESRERLEYFYQQIAFLKSKVGPILFQLPPSFKINQERLEEFINSLQKDYSYVFEFRHPSWYIDPIYELLKKNKSALCITDLHGTLTPNEITSHFAYLRLHGPKKAYEGSYGKQKLQGWRKKIENWEERNISVYCYFDNDEKGYAIEDAKTLSNLIFK